MFTNTAYEALYEHLGLALHSKIIEVITSQQVFLGALMLIFGSVFFLTTLQYFSKYIPGSLVRRRSVPLSKYVKLVLSLFIGLSLLQVESHTSVKNYKRENWATNAYIQQRAPNVQDEYRVSFIFDVLTRTAEEISAFFTRTIDSLFKSTHSQTTAPDFFFKAILAAGTATIDDPNVASSIQFYVDECFDRMIPLVASDDQPSVLSRLFGSSGDIDPTLESLPVPTADGAQTNCLELKNSATAQLQEYAQTKSGELGTLAEETFSSRGLNRTEMANLTASQLLVNHFYDQREGSMAIQKGALPPSGAARIYQYVNRYLSFDNLTSTFFGNTTKNFGAVLAAERAQQFSDNLTRAPHVAGAIKMFLIAMFPFLVFLLAGGYWKALLYWLYAYGSVLLWAPVWTFFYHVVVNLSLSTEQMEAFGKLSDGISLYSSELITQRMNYMYAVFSWIQLFVGVALSGTILFFVRSLMSDSEPDHAPEFVSSGEKVASVAGKVVGA